VSDQVDLLVLYEHPEWQKPLFAALDAVGLNYLPFDLKEGSYDPAELPSAKLVFNQASPSGYVRGNDRSVPLALSIIQSYEHAGVPVVNGSRALHLELSKAAQVSLLKGLGLDYPHSLAFNDAHAVDGHWNHWPALLKPEQGGSGARIYQVKNLAEVQTILSDPMVWQPDRLFLLQEILDYDRDFGIVRLEFLGGELLYAMRVVAHGTFNLCPSEVCNPSDGSDGACAIPTTRPPEFFAYPEVPAEVVEAGKRIVQAGGLDVAGLEYAATRDGRVVFYHINANSNLRPAVAQEFGFDPFDKVVAYLKSKIVAA
jgi:glutathione synthase/RimK-type ligase-like ATP-grasp enzyme